MKNFRQISIVILLLLSGFQVAQSQLPIPEGRRIREIVADKYPDSLLIIGATTGSWAFTDFTGQLMDREFSYVTPENDFKQSVVRGNPEAWNWSRADAWLQHIIDNDQVLRIHGPISPQCSRWAKDDSRTAEELAQELDAFMTALCMRYNDVERIKYLDVVNEIALSDGSWFGPKTGTDSWENPWFIIGQDDDPNKTPLYIKRAFAIANEHAPNLKLILNNHCHPGTAGMEKNKETILYLRDLGYRVDGLGWQAHVDVGWATETNLQHLRDVIDWCQERDLEFHITEFDAWIDNPATQTLEGQAYTYKAIMDVMLQKLDSLPMGWNAWHVTDASGWKTERIPSLFDDKYRPKPAYYSFQLALEAMGDYSTLNTVGFTIRNSETGDTLEGCSVLFNDETIISDDKGAATFDSVTPGLYGLKISHKHMDPLDIDRISIYSDTLITIWMDSADFEIAFRIIDIHSGNAIPNVNIMVDTVEKTTDLAGRITFLVRPGSRSAVFQKKDYADVEADYFIISDTLLTVMLEKTHADVEFWLKTGGAPVNDAMVVLENDTLYTNLLGMCTFYSLAVDSSYVFSVSKEYYYQIEGDFFLQTDTSVELQFARSVAKVEFMLDPGSTGARDALVVLDGDTSWFNASGVARFFNIPLDSVYNYQVLSSNYPELSANMLVKKDTTVTISLVVDKITDQTERSNLKIYPNPASEYIRIHSESDIEFIEVYNSYGKLAGQYHPYESSFRMNISDLPSGCYWIRIKNCGNESAKIEPVIVE